MIGWILALVLAGCGGDDPERPAPTPAEPPPAAPAEDAAPAGVEQAPAERLDVRALSFPAAWLAERVGGARVAVRNVAPEGEDPPSWRPAPQVIADLAAADLIVASGAGYEAWLGTATLPDAKVVRAADGLDLVTVPGVTHSHGKQGAHSHASTDPHVWTDPTLLAAQARNVRDGLVRVDAGGASVYDRHLAALERELEALDREQAEVLAPAAGRKVAASHPAFNYLARRYGLQVTSFDLDPEDVPSEAQVARVEAWAAPVRGAGVEPILLWEAQPTAAVVQALPGVEHVTIFPLEQPVRGVYDPIRQTRANIGIFRRLFAAPAE